MFDSNGWPNGDDAIGTMDKDMDKGLYEALRTPAKYFRFMQQQHTTGHLSDEFLSDEGVPPDEDGTDSPVECPSGPVQVHMQRAHQRNHREKQAQIEHMLAAHHQKQQSAQAQVQVDCSPECSLFVQCVHCSW